MRKRTLNSLGLVICLGLFLGCSSVKPAHQQTVTNVEPADQSESQLQSQAKPQPQSQSPKQQSSSHFHYSWWDKFYNGWLGGQSPPPDFKEEDKTGIAACLGIAYWASITGLLIAGGGR